MEIRTRRRAPLALVGSGLAVALVISACGSSSSGAAGGGGATTTSAGPVVDATTAAAASMSMPASSAASAAAATGTMVDVKNFSFTPMSLTVKVGETVTWKFDDSADHTVKASDGSFSSPPLANGKTWSHTFTKAGTFAYICSIHQYMMGTITVQ